MKEYNSWKAFGVDDAISVSFLHPDLNALKEVFTLKQRGRIRLAIG